MVTNYKLTLFEAQCWEARYRCVAGLHELVETLEKGVLLWLQMLFMTRPQGELALTLLATEHIVQL